MIILGQKCDGVVDNITNNASTTKLWNTFLGFDFKQHIENKAVNKGQLHPYIANRGFDQTLKPAKQDLIRKANNNFLKACSMDWNVVPAINS